MRIVKQFKIDEILSKFLNIKNVKKIFSEKIPFNFKTL